MRYTQCRLATKANSLVVESTETMDGGNSEGDNILNHVKGYNSLGLGTIGQGHMSTLPCAPALLCFLCSNRERH